ncbi:MAG: HAD family hydrolase, partial [Erysipelotrichaceae bacterium]|nr:HAD family hydrolase [Erysipelotrichaceae bacterium]
YEDICNRLDLDPKDCIMIGNDVDEDMVAKELGMKFFLLTDCLINKNNKKIDADFVGTIKELIDNLDSLL